VLAGFFFCSDTTVALCQPQLEHDDVPWVVVGLVIVACDIIGCDIVGWYVVGWDAAGMLIDVANIVGAPGTTTGALVGGRG
jgi:hypothetical protein